MTPQANQAAANSELAQLRQQTAAFKEQERKATVKQLLLAIKHAPFLDPKRRKLWRDAAGILSHKEAKTLLAAVVREIFRWKKGERQIEFTSNL